MVTHLGLGTEASSRVEGRALPNISNAWLLNVSGCNAIVLLKELTLDSTKQL